MGKSLAVRFMLNWTSQVDARVQPIRILLVWDRRPAGTTLTATDVLMDESIYAPYNIADASITGRFQVLFDRTYSGNTDQTSVYDKFFIRRDMRTTFDGATGGIADIETGAFVWLMVSQGGKAGDVSLTYQYMYRFTDM